jgi:O-antigen biosynthesis protein WbqV
LVLAISLLILDYILLSPNFYGTFFFGKITIGLYFVVQTVLLSGSRVAYRYFRETRTQRHARDINAIPTLILGRAADVEVPLRAIESGAISKIWPVGLLSPARSDQGVSVRGVPVLGGFEDLERVIAILRERRTTVTRLVLTPSAFEPSSPTAAPNRS